MTTRAPQISDYGCGGANFAGGIAFKQTQATVDADAEILKNQAEFHISAAKTMGGIGENNAGTGVVEEILEESLNSASYAKGAIEDEASAAMGEAASSFGSLGLTAIGGGYVGFKGSPEGLDDELNRLDNSSGELVPGARTNGMESEENSLDSEIKSTAGSTSSLNSGNAQLTRNIGQDGNSPEYRAIRKEKNQLNMHKSQHKAQLFNSLTQITGTASQASGGAYKSQQQIDQAQAQYASQEATAFAEVGRTNEQTIQSEIQTAQAEQSATQQRIADELHMAQPA